MISMQGVSSALILRNESWVRKQAQTMMRRLPTNIEKADLIQVGLIAVAQTAISFEWDGDRDSEDAKEAFVRYARLRVKGAMLDELRQMDHLGRAERRKFKVIQVTKERWRSSHGAEPTAASVSELSGISVAEIFKLEQAARDGQTASLSEESERDEAAPAYEPATASDEVEARVDTGMLMRRLEKFFATLPERERLVIDSYLGIGLKPIALAASLNVSPSRVSQLFHSVCERIGIHLGRPGHRSIDQIKSASPPNFDDLITARELELAKTDSGVAWAERFEDVLVMPLDKTRADAASEPLIVTSSTRWG
jgi:RNA polymerase sigma factor for flagellar operon FliA